MRPAVARAEPTVAVANLLTRNGKLKAVAAAPGSSSHYRDGSVLVKRVIALSKPLRRRQQYREAAAAAVRVNIVTPRPAVCDGQRIGASWL